MTKTTLFIWVSEAKYHNGNPHCSAECQEGISFPFAFQVRLPRLPSMYFCMWDCFRKPWSNMIQLYMSNVLNLLYLKKDQRVIVFSTSLLYPEGLGWLTKSSKILKTGNRFSVNPIVPATNPRTWGGFGMVLVGTQMNPLPRQHTQVKSAPEVLQNLGKASRASETKSWSNLSLLWPRQTTWRPASSIYPFPWCNIVHL